MAPTLRILLRYGAGALVMKGWLSESDGNMLATDPDVAAMLEMASGGGIALATEGAYWLAKRFGWRT